MSPLTTFKTPLAYPTRKTPIPTRGSPDMLTRLCLTLINLFFPPLSVLLLTGPYTDTLINCLLFIAGVIPSHIHGFYISCTYYHRKGKVRKGKYPGGPKAGIFDERVWRGGASRARVEELRVVGEERLWEKSERKRGKRNVGMVGRRGSRRMDGYDGMLGFRRDGGDYEGYDAQRGNRGSCRGDRRGERSEGLDGRRTILGEVSGRY